MADVAATALVTLKDVKAFVDLRSSDHDEVLKQFINYLSEMVENSWCYRKIKSATYTDELYDGNGTRHLLLRQWPVTAVSSLIGEREGSALVDGTDFEIEKDEGIIALIEDGDLPKFPLSIHGIKITYTAGFTVVPADLQMAVLKAVHQEYKRWDKGATGLLSQGLGTEQAVEYIKTAYPADVMLVFDSYRRRDEWL